MKSNGTDRKIKDKRIKPKDKQKFVLFNTLGGRI